jgi:hypothetical protein
MGQGLYPALDFQGQIEVATGLLKLRDGIGEALSLTRGDKPGSPLEQSHAEPIQLGWIKNASSAMLVEKPAQGLCQLSPACLDDIQVQTLDAMPCQEIRVIVSYPLTDGHAPQVDKFSPKDLNPRRHQDMLPTPTHGYQATRALRPRKRICKGQPELNGSSLGLDRQVRAKVREDFVKAGESLRSTIQGPIPLERVIESMRPDTRPLPREP